MLFILKQLHRKFILLLQETAALENMYISATQRSSQAECSTENARFNIFEA